MKKRRPPDHRYRAVRGAAAPPEHALEAALWHVLHGLDADPNVESAWEIFSEEAERETLNAFMMAQATDEDVRIALDIAPAVTQAYRHLFFDYGAFRDRLHVLSFIRKYKEGHYGTPKGAQLLKDAYINGVPHLMWLYAPSYAAGLDPSELQRQVMIDAYFMGRAQRMFAVGSPESKAAKSYMDTALKIAAVLSKRGDTSGAAALLIKLRHRDMTESIENTRPEDMPLH